MESLLAGVVQSFQACHGIMSSLSANEGEARRLLEYCIELEKYVNQPPAGIHPRLIENLQELLDDVMAIAMKYVAGDQRESLVTHLTQAALEILARVTDVDINRDSAMIEDLRRRVQEQFTILGAIALDELRRDMAGLNPNHVLPSSIEPLAIDRSRVEIDHHQPLGSGGFGRVWKGTYGVTDVAVKEVYHDVTDPGTERRIKNEIHLLHQLRHPNVLDIFGFIQEQASISIVMEIAELGSLKRFLRTPPVPDLSQRWNYVQQMIMALEFIHRCKVVHRDIKPANFLVFQNHRIKLCDFDLARQSYSGNTVAGSPFYFAPEVLNGRGASFKSDVYSFALSVAFACNPVLLTEDFKGQVEYTDAAIGTCGDVVIGNEYLRDLLNRCLDADPERRPSAEELQKALNGPIRSPRSQNIALIDDDAADPSLSFVTAADGRSEIYSMHSAILPPPPPASDGGSKAISRSTDTVSAVSALTPPVHKTSGLSSMSKRTTSSQPSPLSSAGKESKAVSTVSVSSSGKTEARPGQKPGKSPPVSWAAKQAGTPHRGVAVVSPPSTRMKESLPPSSTGEEAKAASTASSLSPSAKKEDNTMAANRSTGILRVSVPLVRPDQADGGNDHPPASVSMSSSIRGPRSNSMDLGEEAETKTSDSCTPPIASCDEDDIDVWLARNNFPAILKTALEELSVSRVQDLQYLDEEHLEQIKTVPLGKTQLGKTVQFRKFLDKRDEVLGISRKLDSTSSTSVSPTTGTSASHTHRSQSLSVDDPEVMRERIEIQMRSEMRREQESRQRQDSIEVLMIRVRHSATVDIVFVMDCTGSMNPYINETKDKICNFVDKVHRLHPDVSLRLAFIGYRDYSENSERLAVLPFTDKASDFQAFVAAQKAKGGGDEAEDVLGALDVAGKMDWRSETKILYHVGDAPCHGREFQRELCGDLYPDGDPNGLQAPALLDVLRQKSVRYFFGKINASTDVMIERFNAIMTSPASDAPFVVETPLQSENMIEIVTKTVSRAVSEVVSSSGRTVTPKIKLKDVTLDPVMPGWPDVAVERAIRYAMTQPESINALVRATDDRCLSDMPDRIAYFVQMAPRPFAKGGLRAAYYGMFGTSNTAVNQPVVIKESLAEQKKYRSKLDYEKFLVCHRAAKFLAREFTRIKPPGCPAIEYCEADIIQVTSIYPAEPFFVREARIETAFEKYNSNTGFCCENPTAHGTNHDAVQAFSHWTHHVTGGQMLVVDCQGGYDRGRQTFVLTDPAVHCKNLLVFGSTNLGENGMLKFFRSHVCNEYCRALSLQMPI